VLAEGLESYATAHAEARGGGIPNVLVLEAVFPTVVAPSLDVDGGHAVSISVRPLPLAPAGGWDTQKAALAARVVSKLNGCVPGLVRHIVGIDILTPDVLASRFGEEPVHIDISRILAYWPSRVCAPIEGLYLCGADADVVPAVSGRAGRIAASLAMAEPR
jgi:phytoene dehydrogenase-like protein